MSYAPERISRVAMMIESALLEQAANHLDAAAECVKKECWELAGSSLRTAAELIGCITGETATPDVLDEIFSRFCIGK